MVVDDDEIMLQMLDVMVRNFGYFSYVCNDPLKALKLFSDAPEKFDAAIVDELMPGMLGTQLTRQLLQIKDDIPVILLTGHGDILTLEEVRQSGVRVSFTKPLEKAILQKALVNLVGPAQS
jgi:CheY-like chemotaxis protein